MPIETTDILRSAQPTNTRIATLAILGASILTSAANAQFRVTDDNKSLFSIPRSQDDIHALKMAQTDSAAGRFASAAERLHALLERDRHGLIPTSTGIYLGMRTAVIRTLRALPAAGQEAYEKITAREAGNLLRTAFVGLNLEGLRSLADRFPTSGSGRRARYRLAELMLEAGEASYAIGEFSSLLEALAPDSSNRQEVENRLAFANSLRRAKDGHASAADSDAALLANGDTKTDGWSAYGDGANTTTPMVFPNRLGSEPLTFPLRSPGYGSYYPLTVHATGGLSGLFFNNGHKVVCLDPLSSRKKWEAAGPMTNSYNNDYSETLNRSMLLSVALSPDIVVAALQVPNATRASSFHQLDLLYKLPSRRLFAFDRHSGKRLWSHFDYEGGPVAKRFLAHNAPAPPIIVGDTVYVPTEHYTGAVSYYLSAYSLKTGEERWRTLICSSQLEVNMFGNAKLEYAATPMAVHEGTLYGTTNLGLNFSADAITGRVKWCSSYPVIPLPRTRLRGQNIRPVFFANNPILVHDGVMISTPLDSEFVIAMNIEDGNILWKMPYRSQAGHQNHLVWTLGLLGEEAIFSGRGVVGVKVQPDAKGQPQVRQIRAPQYINGGISSRIARGAVTKQFITHPSNKTLDSFDREGNPAPRQFDITKAGNLLMIDGLVVSARADEVRVYLDRDFLLSQAREAIERESDNPSHYLRLASLMRGNTLPADLIGSQGTKTLDLLRQGIEAARRTGLGKQSPLYQNLASELFRISMMRADHTATSGTNSDAIQQYQRARNESPDVNSWIRAQLRILGLQQDSHSKALASLELLATKYGTEVYPFEKFGPMPVRSFCLWQSIPHLTSPQTIIGRCQELLELFPDIALTSETARSFAIRTISEVLVKSGRQPYAGIEARASKQLADAGDNNQRLREIDRRFPHSAAALKARQLVLDKAVQAGDLATAAVMAGRSVTGLTPGLMRRLMVAATIAKNLPLAAALGQRLRAEHAGVTSDFGPDKRQTMAEVVEIPELPALPTIDLELPVKQLGQTLTSARGGALEVINVKVVAGYPKADNRPLYATAGGDNLLAFDLSDPDHTQIFSSESNLSQHLSRSAEPLHLCGTHLIINETQQIRALHFRTGKELWQHSQDDGQVIRLLGVQNGIIHLFSSLNNNDDGGKLLGLDVFTGARLFTHVFPITQETLVPMAFEGDLWTLRNPSQSTSVELLRIDGISGQLIHTFKVPAAIVSKLVPPSRNPEYLSLRQLLATMIVDADSIYLTTNNSGGLMSPFLAAFQHQGKLRWTWTGQSKRGFLKLRAIHDKGYVLIETVPGTRISSRLVMLDRKDGSETRNIRMQGTVRILHYEAQPYAPDLLLIEEGDTNSLISFSLDGRHPSFRYPSDQRQVFWPYPVIGPDFLAAPIVSADGRRLELLTLRLKDRRGALPGNRKLNSLPSRISGGSTRIFAHDQYTICQTPLGIQVMGTKEPKIR